MRKSFLIVFFLVVGNMVMAQAPQGIPYQALARNSSGAILASTAISVRFTIRDSVATGAIKYQETQSVITNAQGMFNVNVGLGTVVSGIFSGINWGTSAKFMQVEMDPAGGSSYVDIGTQKMMSVPYSIYSNVSGNGMPSGSLGDILYHNGTSWVKLATGTTGQTLTVGSGGQPFWSARCINIGSSYGGGIVAYIYLPGDPGYIYGETHGLIVATADQSTGIQWGCNGTTVSTSHVLDAGASNTATISSVCGSGTAAKLCSDLVLGGYDDWYLPTTSELEKIYVNRAFIGGFSYANYWSSHGSISTLAFYMDFTLAGGGYSTISRTSLCRVRAVRKF